MSLKVGENHDDEELTMDMPSLPFDSFHEREEDKTQFIAFVRHRRNKQQPQQDDDEEEEEEDVRTIATTASAASYDDDNNNNNKKSNDIDNGVGKFKPFEVFSPIPRKRFREIAAKSGIRWKRQPSKKNLMAGAMNDSFSSFGSPLETPRRRSYLKDNLNGSHSGISPRPDIWCHLREALEDLEADEATATSNSNSNSNTATNTPTKGRSPKKKTHKKKKRNKKEEIKRLMSLSYWEGDYAESNPVVQERQKRRLAVESKIHSIDDLKKIRVLGDGQFGQVWLVQANINLQDNDNDDTDDTTSTVSFALKQQAFCEAGTADALYDDSAGNTDLETIQRELKITQDLTQHHPFIVDLVHTFSNGQSMDFLLGLVPGGELYDVICSQPRGMPELQAEFYTLLLADTLHYIHQKLYIYRDLKAENVMMDVDGYPILVDFGLAKQMTSLEDRTFTFCGTPTNVAPEIINAEFVDGHNRGVDFWALGILVYGMLTGGKHPFFTNEDEMDNGTLYQAICQESPYPIEKFNHDLSSPAIDLVEELLRKKPHKRIGMKQEDLQDFTQHEWLEHIAPSLEDMRLKKYHAPWKPPSSSTCHDDDDHHDHDGFEY